MVWHLRLILVALLLTAAGCVQFTPQFLMGSNHKRAELLWRQGLIIEAREAALMVKRKEPGYKEARLLLAKIKPLSLELAREHMELGEDYYKAGIPLKALSEFRLSLRYNPNNALVKGKLRRLVEGVPVTVKREKKAKAGKKVRRRAKKRKRKAVEADEIGPEVGANIHYMRGKIYLESMAYPKAIVEFKAARKLIPGFLDTGELLKRSVKGLDRQIDRHFNKGISYFQKEEMERAVEEWSIVLRLDPFHKDAQEYKGRAERIIVRIKKIKERQDKKVK